MGSLLTYEATADLETKVTIEGWCGPVEVDQIKGKKITVVPILRAGLGMMEGCWSTCRARASAGGRIPRRRNLSRYRASRSWFPTSKSAWRWSSTDAGHRRFDDRHYRSAEESGCHSIQVLVLVAAPEGIAALEKAHPDVELYTASIDQCLNDKGYIVPGLGDAGDKIFGTK